MVPYSIKRSRLLHQTVCKTETNLAKNGKGNSRKTCPDLMQINCATPNCLFFFFLNFCMQYVIKHTNYVLAFGKKHVHAFSYHFQKERKKGTVLQS